ncbi:hypothetical protein C8Q76DRAFT_787669 [Earliella scabrosa]|nr:hypothetical protein C8Q76DRAFT_787669 [Earliella scabrosa]
MMSGSTAQTSTSRRRSDAALIPSKRARSADTRPTVIPIPRAPPPFEFDSDASVSDAGLVLRTPAGTPFVVSKHLIITVSSVLGSEVAAKEAALKAERRQNVRGIVQIAVPESDQVLDNLLRFIYPIADPEILELKDIADVLQAAVKYEIRAVVQTLTRLLCSSHFLDQDLIQVYDLAIRFNLKDALNLCRRAVLKQPARWPSTSTLGGNLRLGHLHHLIAFHRSTAFAAVSLLEDHTRLQRITWDRVPGGKPPCGGSCWWPLYVNRAQPILQDVPTSTVICDPAFVASIGMGLSCANCRERLIHLLLPGSFIDQLKADIDLLQDRA